MARAYYRAAIVEKLKADLERLAFFCQEPDQQAKGRDRSGNRDEAVHVVATIRLAEID